MQQQHTRPRVGKPLVTVNGLLPRWLIAAVSMLAAVTIAPTHAQSESAAPGPPEEILLLVHSDLKETGFVEPLVCALRRVLIAPVHVENVDLPFGREMLASPTQFDVAKIAERVIVSTGATGGARRFKYFLHPYDMKDRQFHYVFANTFANSKPFPFFVGVVSMKRLQPDDPDATRAERAQIAAMRAYKLILKSIGVGAGLPSPGGCVLEFPRSLEELDRKSSEFCPDDRETLVAAKVLKAQESAGCVYVAQAQQQR